MNSSTRQTIIDAFYDTERGLTRDINKLKKKNPKLQLISNEAIRSVLNQSVVQYNKNRRKRLKDYIKYISTFAGELIHADLMFLASPRNTTQKIVLHDQKRRSRPYLLILVDTWSKFVWAWPLKDKRADAIARKIHKTVLQIQDIFYGMNNTVKYKILTDEGKEFSTRLINTPGPTIPVQNDDFTTAPRIEHIVSRNINGAVLAEGAIYKIRNKLKYMPKTRRALKYSELTQLLNNVNSESEAHAKLFGDISAEEIGPRFYPEDPNLKEFEQGDYVRLKVQKGVFEKKSSLDQFSDKVFVVLDSVFNHDFGIYRYIVGSINGKAQSNRKWYAEQLVKVPFTYMKSMPKDEVKKNSKFTEGEIKMFSLIR